MNNSIWHELCECVWNKVVVIDITNINITVKALLRWFNGKGIEVPRLSAIKLANKLSDMIRDNSIQTASYGEFPTVELSVSNKTHSVYQEDVDNLKSLTPDLLEQAAKDAGFILDVHGLNDNHPLCKWD